jgi:hypothetical protein
MHNIRITPWLRVLAVYSAIFRPIQNVAYREVYSMGSHFVLHYIMYIILHLHYVTLYSTLHYIYITLHVHYITLHYII